MKKLDLSKLDEIKDKHLSYCSNLSEVRDLSKTDKKLLFIENPFTDNMECNPIYQENFSNINLISQYEKFRKYKKTIWNGVDLIKMLNINVCPYCGMNYFSAVKKKKNGEVVNVATLDHYLPKENNKMLALNLYNLIPCCKNCNTTFKGTAVNPIINPYFLSVEENIKFKMNFYDISGTLAIDNTAKDNLNSITENHLNILSLNERYNYFKSIVLSIYKKKLAWNETYITQLSNFKEINLSKEQIKEMLLRQDLFNINEPFIKIKTDIWEQLS